MSEHRIINVEANRRSIKWSRKEIFGRILWDVISVAFRLSPRVCWGFRRWLLRRFGAHVGIGAHIYPTVRIGVPWNLTLGDYSAIGDGAILYSLGLIQIGNRAVVSQGAHLCAGTHDWRQPDFPLVKGPISIGEDAWICADAFVGPSVKIGDGAIVGARAVAMKDIAPGIIVVGNPAQEVRKR